VVFWQG